MDNQLAISTLAPNRAKEPNGHAHSNKDSRASRTTSKLLNNLVVRTLFGVTLTVVATPAIGAIAGWIVYEMFYSSYSHIWQVGSFVKLGAGLGLIGAGWVIASIVIELMILGLVNLRQHANSRKLQLDKKDSLIAERDDSLQRSYSPYFLLALVGILLAIGSLGILSYIV